MKAVILAGGLGTRISEETSVKPKPMVEIGEMPIIWHIMKIYGSYGINDFIVCCGYKGHIIKEFFDSYLLRRSDVRFDFARNTREILNHQSDAWTVTLVDTGEKSMTGGRIKRLKPYLDDSPFFLTYGDGVSDVNLSELYQFHQDQGVLATLTAVQPPGRFGAIALGAEQTKITQFHEKPVGDGAWVNGGFFVCDPVTLDYIDGDDTVWEQEPLKKMARESNLAAYKHKGFWHPMDTLRDKNYLESLWQAGTAPWKTWD